MSEIIRYIKHRRDTIANWASANPILYAGQIGIETDGLLTTPKFKIGDGTTAWNSLPYANTSGSSNPFSDASALVKNSSDATKLALFSASGITTGTTRTYTLPNSNGTLALLSDVKKEIQLACSDETTALTTGTSKAVFRMPYGATITGVRASLTTAQTSGSIFTVDINDSGTSILSTKLTIDNTEKTSTTAATPAVISDASIADDAEVTIDIDQVGDGTAKGLKVTILYTIA